MVHALHVALFVTVVWLIHDAHLTQTQQSPPVRLDSVPGGDVVRQLYGDGARIEDDVGTVVDADGASIGCLLQTSPQSDAVALTCLIPAGFCMPERVW